jgi:hypothetical protein
VSAEDASAAPMSDWVKAFRADKFVMVNAEYACDCIFDRQGGEQRAEYLPVSDEVVKLIRAWRDAMWEWDEKLGQTDDPIDFGPFAEQGYLVACAIKRELPDWTVCYHDEMGFYLAPDRNYCPEILANGSLGPCVDPWFFGRTPESHPSRHIFNQANRND